MGRETQNLTKVSIATGERRQKGGRKKGTGKAERDRGVEQAGLTADRQSGGSEEALL